MNAPAIWTPYCGVGATPVDLALRWNLDPVLLATFAVAAVMLWRRRSGVAGWSALALAAVIFVSPLCALSSALFAARTVHHVLLVAAVAPLAAWALPKTRPGGLLASTLLATVVFWAWHAPGAYAWALSSDAAYWLMQLSLGGAAVAFWMAVRAARMLPAVAALLVSTVQMGLLGAILTVADRPFYAPHATTTFAWGLSPLADQQAAGLIMWAPAASIYLGVALWMTWRALGPNAASSAAT
jgi:putative membrane protein